MTRLEVKNITYLYDKRKTDGVKDISFTLNQSEVLTIIGPSGSGKSTTLKLLASELKPQNGHITISEPKSLQYIPQSTHLDSKLSVFEFLKSELHLAEDEDQKENQIRSTLSILQITNEIHSPLGNLSGGQKQRVIIAKALIHNPDTILLDEPFGHLDESLRFNLIRDLMLIFKEKEISTLWVTHDIKEAIAFSDKTIIMNFGKIIQVASPLDIYTKPANILTAKFLGIKNIFAVNLDDNSEVFTLTFLGKKVQIPKEKSFELKEHKEAMMVISNNGLKEDPQGSFKASIQETYYYGDFSWLRLKSTNGQFLWIKSDNSPKSIGTEIRFELDPSQVYLKSEF